MTVADRRRGFRQRLFLSFLAVLALASARQLIISPSHGQDFRDFYAAATLVAHGGNPYDNTALAREQEALYNLPGHRKPGDSAYYDALPYPQGPWVALAIVPSTALPWQAAYALYLAAALAALTVSAWTLVRLLGFTGRLVQAAVGAVLASPIAFINLFQGQPVPFLLAAFVGAWTLQRRGRPLLAGVLLSIGWIKPHIGLPLVVVAALLEPASVRRLLVGFLGGTLALFGFAAVIMPGALLDWPLAVLGQWSGTLQQADLASINAFYYPALSGALRQLVLALVLIVAAGYCAWLFRHNRESLTRALTLLLLTFLAAPYAHSYDTLLLIPVLVAMVGPRLAGWRDPAIEISLWAFAAFPIFYFAGFHIGYFNGFTAIPVTLLALAWHQARTGSRRSSTVPVAA
ncbi:MAG TPA: glycosyltransferase family 87 protein [Candidatus Dormibacteraeota bacterium]|nr:glycosyltransferase family 87 protein [Candidatus Dormibacteraeota bacterium]